MLKGLGDFNFALSFAAIGSALGCGVAGMATIGAWKKAYVQNKVAPILLAAFVGAPLTQTFYGFILSLLIRNQALGGSVESYTTLSLFGLLAGIPMGASAFMQGKAAARACDAFVETGKGFTNYLTALGIIETVALFVMIIFILAIPKV